MLTPGCQSKNEIIVKHLGVWLEKVFFAKIPIGTRLKKCFLKKFRWEQLEKVFLFGPFYKKVCKLIFFLSIFANDKEKMNYAHF
jgi:hypothetical protein